MASDFGLSSFKQSAMGRRIAPIIEDRRNVRDMEALTRCDLPAVRVIGKQLLAAGVLPRNEEAKKHIGRWVRELMHQRGWEPLRKGKLPRGNLFSTGAIYRPRQPTRTT